MSDGGSFAFNAVAGKTTYTNIQSGYKIYIWRYLVKSLAAKRTLLPTHSTVIVVRKLTMTFLIPPMWHISLSRDMSKVHESMSARYTKDTLAYSW